MGTRLFVFIGLLFSASAFSQFPSKPGEDPWANRPNDPGYGEAWQLFSHLPVDHTGKISDLERGWGSGLHVDKAWQLHTGTPDTVIAVLDSGIFWDEEDLIERFFLNRGELPLPEGSTEYDKNHDGRFSVSDYAGDSRVKDVNHNHRIDPEDLIASFSDGKDNDGNGYVDDICGWDFHEHDNNPYDRTRFGHGTGEAKDSTAALNNGVGDSGVCGNCSIVPLRVNDSFVVDANSFAAAVRYAADLKVTLIQQALGSVNYSPFTKAALEYAYQKGVPVIGSAADECSYHHNYPSALDPVIYANAIRYDTPKYQDATTFVNFNNCSNFGARVDVAVPALHCSSEATGLLSGVSALVLSYAKSVGKALSPGELAALIKNSATDIALGPASETSERYPTYAGWDSTTGYGRANAFQMMKAIEADRIPPEARILTPEWFSTFRAGEASSLSVAFLGKGRVGPLSGKLEIVSGVETSAGERKTVWELARGRRTSTAVQFDGRIDLSLDVLFALRKNERDPRHFENAFTLILSVVDGKGVRSESRRTIFAFRDGSLFANFPQKMAGSGESSGLFFDLNGDGKEEYVTADGAGWIHAYTFPSGELPGFPAATASSRYDKAGTTFSSIVSPIAIADLDGDGSAEIVCVSLEGMISVVNAQGKAVAPFPIDLPLPASDLALPDQVISQGSFAAPVLVDLDKDGKREIVLVANDGLVHVYRLDGTVQPGFPYAPLIDGKRAKILSSPAVDDINGDGILDIVFGTNHAKNNTGFLFALDGRGSLAPTPILPGFPASVALIRDSLLPTVGTGIPSSPVIADLDGDGVKEIVIQPFVGKTYIYGLDGIEKRSMSMKVSSRHDTNDQFMISALGNAAVGDLEGKGRLNIVSPGVGKRLLVAIALGGKRYEHHHMIGAWDATTGAMLEGLPKRMEDMVLSPSPVTVDIDGDGKEEVVVGSGGYYLHAFSQAGELAGFPKFTGGWMYGSASIGDFDGDGRIDIAVSTREGYVFIWRTDSQIRRSATWPTFKGGPARLGTTAKTVSRRRR